MPKPALTDPATAIEKAELLTQAQTHMGPAMILMVRRICYELDRVKAEREALLTAIREGSPELRTLCERMIQK